MKRTGAQILWEALVLEGVTDVFGYPGGAILPAYDAMLSYPIRHILVRHEQGAGHAATGYAQATGRVGVCMATSGPGATNMVTGIATAMLDSSPIVCITGQVGSKLIGSDAFQETDITGVTLPITKHNYLVTTAADVAATVRAMSSGLVTRKLCLVIGSVMPEMSASWNPSVPIRLVDTWPVMQTIGELSIIAVARPVTMLVAPGPDVAIATPTLPVARA